jgi:hypothetical protein
MFNLWVPHVCLLLANVGSRSKRKSVPYGFKSCDRGWVPLLAKDARNGAPTVLIFRFVRNRP